MAQYLLDTYSSWDFEIACSGRQLDNSASYAMEIKKSNLTKDLEWDSNGDPKISDMTSWLGGVQGVLSKWYNQADSSNDYIEESMGRKPKFIDDVQSSGSNSGHCGVRSDTVSLEADSNLVLESPYIGTSIMTNECAAWFVFTHETGNRYMMSDTTPFLAFGMKSNNKPMHRNTSSGFSYGDLSWTAPMYPEIVAAACMRDGSGNYTWYFNGTKLTSVNTNNLNYGIKYLFGARPYDFDCLEIIHSSSDFTDSNEDDGIHVDFKAIHDDQCSYFGI